MSDLIRTLVVLGVLFGLLACFLLGVLRAAAEPAPRPALPDMPDLDGLAARLAWAELRVAWWEAWAEEHRVAMEQARERLDWHEARGRDISTWPGGQVAWEVR